MTRKEERLKAAQMYKKHPNIDSCLIPSAEQNAFYSGAEWSDKTMIDKACEWLEPVFQNYAGYNCGMDLVNNFRKAMEE